MQYLAQVFFAIMAATAIWFFARNIGNIRKVILMGKDEPLTTTRQQRFRNLVFLAFGQQKMFKNPLVAVLHFILYAGFVIINIEVLEIVLDGLLGTHRLFAPVLGGMYSLLINSFEWLAAAVLVTCLIFLTRRNVLKIRRFMNNDLAGWPRSDANYILMIEIILMSLFLLMNAADGVLQSRGIAHYAAHPVGPFMVSGWLQPILQPLPTATLIFIERAAWWLHIAGILAFLNYLPYSKHLHILFAFPNAWFARPQAQGKMQNMPEIQKEVALALGQDISQDSVLNQLPDAPPAQFGAKDIFDLSWKNLLDAYSCTECGRCSASCPANETGKLLSPRAIMMKTRDRADAVAKVMAANKGVWVDDGKNLLHDLITVEELRACTTCNACVEACPVSISPLDIILKQRRYLILDESNSTNEWNAMFGNIENNFAPWKFNPEEREAWVHG